MNLSGKVQSIVVDITIEAMNFEEVNFVAFFCEKILCEKFLHLCAVFATEISLEYC